MKLAGVAVRQRRKFRVTTDSKHNLPVAPNLLERQFDVAEPNRIWVSDITYIWTTQGYQVQLNDSQYQRVWNFDVLPNTATSVVYNGPALNSCQTYRYHLVSKIGAEDVDNQSLPEGSFYYGYCPQITFNDVLSDHWAYDYINAIYNAGITTGCAQDDPNTPENERRYGPDNPVSREQMAVFIIRALYGETFSYTPTPYFTDVPSSHWAFKYVQKLKELGITTGCGYDQYCPHDLVTREQMAAFLIRARAGEDFSCSSEPYFSDVTSDYWAFDYIQKLKELGITTGYGDGTYGPDDSVTRDQMAAFLTRAFLR
jgi:hypothetical protein